MPKNRLGEELNLGLEESHWSLYPPEPVKATDEDPEKMFTNFVTAALQGVSDSYAARESRTAKSVQIASLRSKEYRLRIIIPVYLEQENDSVTATWYDIGQYGSGPSEDDAIADLCSAIIEYYQLLKKEEHSLSAALRGHLHCLESIIECSNAA